MKTLEGKKTYIGIIAFFILGGLKAINVIDDSTYAILIPIIGGWTAYGLRSAINKI
jgi:hypothetical protein